MMSRLFRTSGILIPQGTHGAVLVTSRLADTRALVEGDSTNFIQLGGLKESEALNLLLHQSRVKASKTSTEDAKDIIERLGYLPLAVTQAGSYIKKREMGLHQFLNHYKRRKEIILKTTAQLPE